MKRIMAGIIKKGGFVMKIRWSLFLVAFLLVAVMAFTFTGCASDEGGDDETTASNDDAGDDGSDGDSDGDATAAFIWTGSEWQAVNWDTITSGLTDIDKLSITEQTYAKSGTTFYKSVSTGYDSYGHSKDVLEKSDDGGSTWSTISHSDNRPIPITSVDIIDNVIYVSTWWKNIYANYPTGWIHKSEDEGNTWTEVLENGMFHVMGVCGFNSNLYYVIGPYVINLNNYNEKYTVTNGGGIERIEATDSAIYALSWGDVYESKDLANWEKIGSDMEDMFVFNSKLYAFPKE